MGDQEDPNTTIRIFRVFFRYQQIDQGRKKKEGIRLLRHESIKIVMISLISFLRSHITQDA